MQRKLSPRPTFKPRVESLETRDLPSVAGVALYMHAQAIQQGVQAMQVQANAVSSDFKQLGADFQASNGAVTSAVMTDLTKIGAEIQAVRSLNDQIQAHLQVFNQAVVGVASNGDQSDQTLAVFSYLQVNGLSLFPGFNSGDSLASQSKNALDQANGVATNTQLTLPDGTTIPMPLTFHDRLNGKS